MQTNVNRQKGSRYLKSLYSLANLHRLLAPEESQSEKPDVTRPYNRLTSENISKFYKKP